MELLNLLEFLNANKTFVGVVTSVVAFFLWKDWFREKTLQKRVESLEADQKDILLPLVKQCATIIAENTRIMSKLEELLRDQIVRACTDEQQVLKKLLEDARHHRQGA